MAKGLTRREFLAAAIATPIAAALVNVSPGAKVVQVYGAMQTGSSLYTQGWAEGSELQIGDVFVIESACALNPLTCRETSILQQFVVTATVSADSAGHLNIPIAPNIRIGGKYPTLARPPANGSILYCLGGNAFSIQGDSA